MALNNYVKWGLFACFLTATAAATKKCVFDDDDNSFIHNLGKEMIKQPVDFGRGAVEGVGDVIEGNGLILPSDNKEDIPEECKVLFPPVHCPFVDEQP